MVSQGASVLHPDAIRFLRCLLNGSSVRMLGIEGSGMYALENLARLWMRSPTSHVRNQYSAVGRTSGARTHEGQVSTRTTAVNSDVAFPMWSIVVSSYLSTNENKIKADDNANAFRQNKWRWYPVSLRAQLGPWLYNNRSVEYVQMAC